MSELDGISWLPSVSADAWPTAIFDAIEAHGRLSSCSAYRRRRHVFQPAEPTAHAAKRPRSNDESGSDFAHENKDSDNGVVENEAGLCTRMEAVQAAVAASGIVPARSHHILQAERGQPAFPEQPALADAVQAQHALRGMRMRSAPLLPSGGDRRACLAPPLLTNGLMRNATEHEMILSALGHEWLVPPQSAFALSDLDSWVQLPGVGTGRTTTEARGGQYRLLLLDPPWHSASVARKKNYQTLDKRLLMERLGPLVPRLACADGCLVAVWVTNSRAVQAFVEEGLFRRWSCRPLARWYWLKLAADGAWAAPGAEPRSPHRKPWEVCLLGYIGPVPPPSALLPERLALCSAPLAHSMKPPLDALLRPLAAHLQSATSHDGVAASGTPATAAIAHAACADACRTGRGEAPSHDHPSSVDGDAAWRSLAKLELFAREVRPTWHAAGNEVLRFQHRGCFEEARPAVVTSGRL